MHQFSEIHSQKYNYSNFFRNNLRAISILSFKKIEGVGIDSSISFPFGFPNPKKRWLTLHPIRQISLNKDQSGHRERETFKNSKSKIWQQLLYPQKDWKRCTVTFSSFTIFCQVIFKNYSKEGNQYLFFSFNTFFSPQIIRPRNFSISDTQKLISWLLSD